MFGRVDPDPANLLHKCSLGAGLLKSLVHESAPHPADQRRPKTPHQFVGVILVIRAARKRTEPTIGICIDRGQDGW